LLMMDRAGFAPDETPPRSVRLAVARRLIDREPGALPDAAERLAEALSDAWYRCPRCGGRSRRGACLDCTYPLRDS
jgi:hypothetical protein